MIDSLQLMLTDFDASNADLELQPGAINTKTGEKKGDFPLYVKDGQYVCGRKAYNNSDSVRASIKPVPNHETGGMTSACFVALEVPKAAGTSNYHPVDRKGFKEALDFLQRHCDEIGLKTNVMTAQPSRMDAFRNVVADEPYSCYAPVFKLLPGSRVEQRAYENGLLWENGRQQVSVYDKLEKMKRDKLSVAGLPPNTIRFEMRLLQSQKIKDVLSVSSARELLENYDAITTAYETTMKKQLFSYSVRDVDAMFASDLKAEISWFKENTGRNYQQHWLIGLALKHLAQRDALETVLDVFSELEADRMKLSRIRKSMRKAHFDVEALRSTGTSTRSTGQLYNEMREKVLNQDAA